jgi:CBS domain containing-hemolysin-like protein
MNLIGDLLVIVLLIAASAFFVAAEFALVRVRASQLRPLARQGGKRVKLALKLLKHLDIALSATQIGITVVNMGLGYYAEPAVHHWIEQLFPHIGVTDPAVHKIASLVIAFGGVSFAVIVFGELVPKLIAIQRPRQVTMAISAPLMVCYYALYPFIVFMNGCANRVIRVMGLEAISDNEHAFSPEELDYVFSHAQHSHPADALINKIMVRTLRLRDVKAAQVMLPRDQVIALWIDRPLAENLRIAQQSGHSRFPVCEGSLDNLRGIVLVKEWLWQMHVLGADAPMQDIMRPALTFLEKTPMHTMVELFRSSRSHLAVVLNSEGGMAGILTFEDALEEIVGEIRDELDIERGPIFEQSENSILVDARLSMRELRAETGWPIEYQPKETVTEWVVRHLGSAPRRGEEPRIAEFRIAAPDVHSGGMRRVRITRLTAKELEATEV